MPVWAETLTAPERVGQAAVDATVELLADGPEGQCAQLGEVDNQPAHHKDKANEQVHHELGLQVGKQAHGRCSGAGTRSFTENSRPASTGYSGQNVQGLRIGCGLDRTVLIQGPEKEMPGS